MFEHDRFILNVYDFAKSLKLKRDDMVKFINSSVAKEVRDTVEELDAYLVGGNKQLREAYGHIPKPRARKIRNYLHGFLEDALRYERDRKLVGGESPELEINKGVELMLRNKNKQKREDPKTFQVRFGKMVSLFRREFHIFFEFSFDTRKQHNPGE